MDTLGTVANIFGVITPAKDVVEIIKAIADSVEEVKRNRTRVSDLIEALKIYIMRLDTAILRYTDASDTQRRSLLELQKSLILTLKELVEQSRTNSAFFGFSLGQWWNSGNIEMRLRRLEKKIKLCHDLFLFDSLTHLVHTVDTQASTLISIQTQLINSSDCTVRLNQGDKTAGNGRKARIERTAIIWKTPMKADLSHPKIMNYVYLSNKVLDLQNYLSSNDGWIEQLFRDKAKDFTNKSITIVRPPIGDPANECEDASHKAVTLSRAIQDQNPYISVVQWFDDLHGLALSLYKVGLMKEAQQIFQFEYHILTLLSSDSKQGSNVDSHLGRCLYNMASIYYKEGRIVKAFPLLQRVVEIERRLGVHFVPFLAKSLRFLSVCSIRLGRFQYAMESLQEGVDALRGLVSDDPLRYGPLMADCMSEQAFLFITLQDYHEAIECSEEAIEWLSRSSPRFKDDFPCEYAWCQWFAAIAYKELGDFGRAEEYGREVSKLFNRLIHDRPMFYLKNSSSTVPGFSSWLQSMGRSEDAMYILEESLAVYSSITPSPAAQKNFADTLYRRAEILHSSEKLTEALDAFSQVIDVRRQLLDEDETDFNCLLGLLSAFRLRSSCLIFLRRQPEAIKCIETALDILQSSLVKVELGESQINSILRELISQESMLEKLDSTETVKKLKEFRRALVYIEEAIMVFRQRMLDGERTHSNLARLLELRYLILFQTSKFDIALISIREAVNLYCHIVDKDEDIENRIDLITALSSQVVCLESMERTDEALDTLNMALQQIRSILHDKQSANFFDFFVDVLYDYGSLFESLTTVKEHLKALDAINTSMEILQSLNVGDTDLTGALLGSLSITRSICCFGLGRFEEAFEYAKEALRIYRNLMAEDADEHEWNLARSLYECAKSSLALNSLDDTLKSIEEAIDIDSRIELNNPDEIHHNLSNSITLRAEILYRLGGAADVQSALCPTWVFGIYAKNDSKMVAYVN